MSWRHPRPSRLRQVLALAALLTASALSADEPTARPAYPEGKWLGANEPFEIALEGTGEGEFAVTLGTLDISSLLERPSPQTLRYHGRGPALPAGQHTITVYRVEPAGGWTEIGQFPIQLLSPRGFISTRIAPTFDLTGKGQFGEEHAPDENVVPRSEFQDGTTQLGFRTELVRPAFTIRSEAQVTGVTYQNEALRFGEKGDRAPRVDLSGYRFDIQRGSAVLSFGHLDFGAHRHLVTGFQSRGVKLTVGEGRALSLQLAALNGTSIVGWSNALGLANSRHQIRGATLGVEARPRTPGLLRLEYGYFDGSLQPLTSFNDGGIVTAETSRGNTYRLASADPGGRWTFDGGYTVSHFDDGFDAEVDEGLQVTPIEARSSDAFYAELSLALLKERKLGRTSANVTLNVRHEDIEPLFRSLGVTTTQPDLRTSLAEVAFNVGSVTGTAGHGRTRDNLAGLASIFTTRTERSSLLLGLPTGIWLARDGVQPGWAPTLSLQADTLHQFGEGLPASGEFGIESLPDQVSTNLGLAAQWQVGSFQVGGRFGAGSQDNRQVGSERQDLETSTSALTLGWMATKLSLNGELGLERSKSEDQQKTDSTLRWAASGSWTFYKEFAVAGSLTNIRAWDDLDARDSENIDGFLELSTGFRLSRADRRRGRIFVRWVDQRGDLIDRSFGLRDSRRNAALSTGLTVSLFQ